MSVDTRTEQVLPLFVQATQQFTEAADLIDLPQMYRTILEEPKNEIIVNFPVELDNGEFALFRGYRIQHSDALGPYKGGVRFHPSVDLDEVKALASWMTWKSSLMRLPFGGAKGGVAVDPTALSPTENRRLVRRFTHALGTNIGPDHDIPAPDMGTNAQTMVWMMDTYAQTVGPHDRNSVRRVVTGKTIECGGSVGRDAATGQGAVYAIRHWFGEQDRLLEGNTAAIQGFGNVGSHTARILHDLGVRVVAIADHTGAIADEKGIDVPELLAHDGAHGSIEGFTGTDAISVDEFWASDVELLIPAALESQITMANVDTIRARVIVEAANGPVTPDAEEKLLAQGIDVLPDILVNAGGVAVSYAEWVQNRTSNRWSVERVDEHLRTLMWNAADRVLQRRDQLDCTRRQAAYCEAIDHVRVVYDQRGIFP